MAGIRRILREIWPPALIAAFVSIATALDFSHYGPHAEGSMWPLILLVYAATPVLGIWAGVKKRWLRAGFYVLALAVCIVCWELLDAASYCPECRA